MHSFCKTHMWDHNQNVHSVQARYIPKYNHYWLLRLCWADLQYVSTHNDYFSHLDEFFKSKFTSQIYQITLDECDYLTYLVQLLQRVKAADATCSAKIRQFIKNPGDIFGYCNKQILFREEKWHMHSCLFYSFLKHHILYNVSVIPNMFLLLFCSSLL